MIGFYRKLTLLTLLLVPVIFCSLSTVKAEWRSVGTLDALRIVALTPSCNYRVKVSNDIGQNAYFFPNSMDLVGNAWGGPNLFFDLDYTTLGNLQYTTWEGRSNLARVFSDPDKYHLYSAGFRVTVRPVSGRNAQAFAYASVIYFDMTERRINPYPTDGSTPKWHSSLKPSFITLEEECNKNNSTTSSTVAVANKLAE